MNKLLLIGFWFLTGLLSGCLAGSEVISLRSTAQLEDDVGHLPGDMESSLGGMRVNYFLNNGKVLKSRALRVPQTGSWVQYDEYAYDPRTPFAVTMLVNTSQQRGISLDAESIEIRASGLNSLRPVKVSTESIGGHSVCHILRDGDFVEYMLPVKTRMISLDKLPQRYKGSGCIRVLFDQPISVFPPTTEFELLAHYYFGNEKIEVSVGFLPEKITEISR